MVSTESTPRQRTALYRYFDGEGVLLYVGISLSAVYRMSRHRAEARWFRNAQSVTIEWFETRAEAAQAEARAIKAEGPRFNVVHADRIPKAVAAAIEASPHVIFYRRWQSLLDQLSPEDAAILRNAIPL